MKQRPLWKPEHPEGKKSNGGWTKWSMPRRGYRNWPVFCGCYVCILSAEGGPGGDNRVNYRGVLQSGTDR